MKTYSRLIPTVQEYAVQALIIKAKKSVTNNQCYCTAPKNSSQFEIFSLLWQVQYHVLRYQGLVTTISLDEGRFPKIDFIKGEPVAHFGRGWRGIVFFSFLSVSYYQIPNMFARENILSLLIQGITNLFFSVKKSAQIFFPWKNIYRLFIYQRWGGGGDAFVKNNPR